jgi:hypothetical protein
MAILIIPAAGLSSRFGLEKPKFLLQSPHGRPMIAEALTGFTNLENSKIDSVVIITQKQFLEGLSVDYLVKEIQNVIPRPVDFKLIDGPTQSMVQTLTTMLVELENDNEFIVKDCDNSIGVDLSGLTDHKNAISYVDLRDYPNVVAHNKSFIKINSSLLLDEIIEKEIVSPFINVGCVKFGSVSSFLSAVSDCQINGELFVSDIVRVLISRGEIFQTLKAETYDDWGTLAEWRQYCARFATYFVDIDGVLAVNSDPLKLTQNWESFTPLEKNCARLLKLQEDGHLVFTTSRHSSYRESLEKHLFSIGFRKFDLVMGLPHAKRVLINDFAPTNPYPTSIAVNIPRNSDNLSDYI